MATFKPTLKLDLTGVAGDNKINITAVSMTVDQFNSVTGLHMLGKPMEY